MVEIFKLLRLSKLLKTEAHAPLLFKTGIVIVSAIVLMAVAAPLLTPYSPVEMVSGSLLPPSLQNPMGTDLLGYDVFSRVLFGARLVLVIVATAAAFSLVIGAPLGLFSGFKGGALDRGLSMVMDSLYAFPSLILAIAIAAAIGPSPFTVVIAISVVYIPTYFRMIRAQTLTIKEQLYVEAAKATGVKPRWIMLKHMLPNMLPTLVIVFSLSVADAVLTEAGLSFFGLSVQAPTPDWGYDLRAGQPYLPSGYWWLITFPGIMIILLAVGFSFIGEGLGEMMSPRLQKK
jgi:peptide/nickel transport system permease protein